jgi:hypothetical protein
VIDVDSYERALESDLDRDTLVMIARSVQP